MSVAVHFVCLLSFPLLLRRLTIFLKLVFIKNEMEIIRWIRFYKIEIPRKTKAQGENFNCVLKSV